MSGISALSPVKTVNLVDTVELVLEKELMKVEKTMQEMALKINDATATVVLKAAKQTALLIANLKVACKDDLQTPYFQSEKLQATIKLVEKLVQDIIDKKEKELGDIEGRMQTITSTVKIPDGMPALTSVTHSTMFASGDIDDPTKVIVTIGGKFTYVEKPQLRLNGKDYLPKKVTKEELTFEVDLALGQQSLDKCTLLNGILTTPWKYGYVPGWSWTTSSFKIPLTVLPSSPGKVSGIFSKTELITKKWDNIVDIPSNKLNLNLTCSPTEGGWKVVKGSEKAHWVDKFGDINYVQQSCEETGVVFLIERKKGIGKFQVTFDQTLETQKPRTVTAHDLRWGKVVVLKPEDQETLTSLTLTTFYGNVVAIKPGVPNPFFECVEDKGTIVITAKKPHEVNISDFALASKKGENVTPKEPKETKEFKKGS